MIVERRNCRAWRRCAVALLCGVIQLASASSAFAFWDWLDDLSGPGPWSGDRYQFNVLCFNDRGSVADAENDSIMAFAKVNAKRAAPSENDKERETIKYWAQFADSPDAMLVAAAEINAALSTQTDSQTQIALAKAAKSWQAAAHPRVSAFPGFVFYASCLDNRNPTKEVVRGGTPAPALLVEIRHLTTTNSPNGHEISMNMLMPKISFPLTGRYDVVDAEAGIGRYWITQDGLDTLQGLVFEPVRLQVHAPVALMKHGCWGALTAVSFSAGFVMFRGGFGINAFGKDSNGNNTPALPGGEAIFEHGIAINPVRLAPLARLLAGHASCQPM